LSHDTRARRSELIDKITTFIVVNMLWVVFAALVITLPAATAGLFATLVPWTQGRTSEPFRDFFGGMRRHWRKSTMIVLLDAVLAGLIALNLAILNSADDFPALCSRNVALFVAALTIMANVYLWPLLVSVDWPVRQLIRVALKLVFLHPIWSLVASLLAVLPLLLTLMLPRFIVILVSFSSCALLASWGAQHVFEQHRRDHASPF
jgi:uncharacterized membrane protein YesL